MSLPSNISRSMRKPGFPAVFQDLDLGQSEGSETVGDQPIRGRRAVEHEPLSLVDEQIEACLEYVLDVPGMEREGPGDVTGFKLSTWAGIDPLGWWVPGEDLGEIDADRGRRWGCGVEGGAFGMEMECPERAQARAEQDDERLQSRLTRRTHGDYSWDEAGVAPVSVLAALFPGLTIPVFGRGTRAVAAFWGDRVGR